jgi:hypothetical protein
VLRIQLLLLQKISVVRVLMICIALYIKVTVLTDGEVISHRCVCSDIRVKINMYLAEEGVHLLYNTRTFVLTTKHERMNPFVTSVGKGCSPFASL